MKFGKKTAVVFKIRNRQGYAAICDNCLTEGTTKNEAISRMHKALQRIEKKQSRLKSRYER